ncbi:MAG: leucine-rich repeat protein, partial [Eubacteriales bacterium]
PGSLKTMGTSLFAGDTELLSITFEYGFHVVPDEAFSGCYLLKYAIIPSSVTDFGKNVFDGCTGLKIECPLGSKAEAYATETGIGYATFSDLLISGGLLIECLSSPVHLDIPGTIDSIAKNAFENCKKILTINIPDSVIIIENDAFWGFEGFTVYCHSGYAAYNYAIANKIPYIDLNDFVMTGNTVLQYIGDREFVEVPYYATGIADSAFYNCDIVKQIVLPDGVTCIGASAFSNCDSLITINLPAGLTSFGIAAFSDCVKLESAFIPIGITVISSNLFYNCICLASVSLPANLTQIGDNSFYGCSNLTTITIPSNVLNIGNSAFNSCIRLLSVKIPTGATRIGTTAFFKCTTLKDVTIPASVLNIENAVFDLCPNLYIYCYSGSAALTYAINNGLNYVNLDDFVWSARDQISNYSGIGGNVVIPNFVTLIHDSTFKEKLSITSVTLPSGLLYIGDYAFFGCQNMAVANIPSSVTHIGRQAFSLCHALTSVTIPAGVISTGYASFFQDNGLTNITIENGVTAISDLMFGRCPGLKTVILPDSVTSIGSFAFGVCSNLTEITIPASVTNIGEGAFGSCDQLSFNCYSGSAASIYAKLNSIDYSFITSPGIVPTSGKTTVINREQGFIYGLAAVLPSINGHITAQGGASYQTQNSSSVCGTGSTITVLKNGKTLESYKVVIFGDANGDGNIDSIDAGIFVDIENGVANWNPTTDAARYMAGDLNDDGNVDYIDAGIAVDSENAILVINQVNGLVIYN